MLKLFALLIFLPVLAVVFIGGGLLTLPFAIAEGVFGLLGGVLGLLLAVGLAFGIIALLTMVLGAAAVFVVPIVVLVLLVGLAAAIIPVALPLLLLVGLIWLIARSGKSTPAKPALPAPSA